MMLSELPRSHAQMPSRSRMRYVQAQLDADSDAILREIAYVLKLTQQVKQEMHIEATEVETVGA